MGEIAKIARHPPSLQEIPAAAGDKLLQNCPPISRLAAALHPAFPLGSGTGDPAGSSEVNKHTLGGNLRSQGGADSSNGYFSQPVVVSSQRQWIYTIRVRDTGIGGEVDRATDFVKVAIIVADEAGVVNAYGCCAVLNWAWVLFKLSFASYL